MTLEEELQQAAVPKGPPPPPGKPPSLEEQLQAAAQEKPQEKPQEPLSTTEKVLLTGARVVPPLVAGIFGTPALAVPVGAGSEYLAQKYEQHRGARKDVSKGGVALAGALSAIPGMPLESLAAKPLLRIGARVGEGALIGGGATTASTVVEEGRLPSLDELLIGAATGGAFGAGGAVLEHATGAGRAAARVEGEVKPAVADDQAARAARVRAERPDLPGRVIEYDGPEGRQTGTVKSGYYRMDGPVAVLTDGREIGPEHNPRIVGEPEAQPKVAPPVEGVQAERSVEGGPAPKVAAEAPKPPAAGEQLSFETPSYKAVPKVEPPQAPKPPLERAEPTPEPGRFEQPSFRKVPGLHEAAFGEPPTPARPRDPERLQGEIARVDTQFAHLPEEDRNVLKAVKLQQAEETAWRARETQPVQRTKDLADELVFNPEVAARKPRGQTMKAEELHATGSHIADILDDMQPLSEHVAANPDDITAQLQLKKKQTELVLSVSAFEGAKAETGRALGILRYQMAALKKGDPAVISRALKLGAKADDILNIMRLPTDQAKMRALMALRKPTRWEIARSYWMSNLLSGPKTLIRNTIGNTIPPALDIITTPFAAGIERLRGVPLEERTVFAGEVPKKLRALGLFGTEKIGEIG